MPEQDNLQPPSDEELQAIRLAINEHVSENPGDFWPDDVQRLMNEDHYAHRFYWHSKEDPGNDPLVSKTISRIKRTFQWRKEVDPAGIKPSDISPILKEKGNLYLYKKDCDGKPLLVMCMKRHYKGIDSMDNMKKLIHFYMEKVDRETTDGLMTFVIDCFGGGLRGLDLELIQCMIGAFKESYPSMLNYIFVLEMPWVLNAAWKLIKSWLPEAGVRKIRFLGKSNLTEYIPADQQITDWGGTVEWPFNFEDTLKPLGFKMRHSSAVANGDGKDHVLHPAMTNGLPNGHLSQHDSVVEAHKTTTTTAIEDHHPMSKPAFVKSASIPIGGELREKPNRSISVEDTSMRSTTSSSFNEGPLTSSKAILRISTGDEVVFEQSTNNGLDSGLLASFQIDNVHHKHVAFKIMTTTPIKYRVKPSTAFLKAGQSCVVTILVSRSHLAFEKVESSSTSRTSSSSLPELAPETVAAILLDKFIVNAISLNEDEANEDALTNSKLGELLKTRIPEARHRLRCTIKGVPRPPLSVLQRIETPSQNGPSASAMSPPSSTLASANRQLETLTKKVGKLEVTMVELQDVVLSQRRFMMLLLALVLVLQVAILVHMWGTSSGSEAAPPIAMEAPAEPPSGSLPPADLPLAPHVHGQSGDL